MYLVPVLFTFYTQYVLKLKKNNSGAKRLISDKLKQLNSMQYFCCKISTTNSKIIFEGKYLIREGQLGVRLPVGAREYDFSTPAQTGSGATETPVQCLLRRFPNVERPRCDTDRPPLQSILDLYCYSLSLPS